MMIEISSKTHFALDEIGYLLDIVDTEDWHCFPLLGIIAGDGNNGGILG